MLSFRVALNAGKFPLNAGIFWIKSRVKGMVWCHWCGLIFYIGLQFAKMKPATQSVFKLVAKMCRCKQCDKMAQQMLRKVEVEKRTLEPCWQLKKKVSVKLF
jgi:Na+(H+)/acetate symporter ActP